MSVVRRPWLLLILALVALPWAAGALAPAAGSPAPAASVSGSTIVEVTGSAEDGFTIRRLDGTVSYPPTDSEALAECGEYDTLRARVRCRTHVRTWYADLAEMQKTIGYYRRLLD